MNEQPYSNRQIEKMLDDSVNDIKEHITLHIDPLSKQVTYTNGKVRWLEKMMYVALGSFIILAPIFGYWMKDYFQFKDTYQERLDQSVAEAFEKYLNIQGYDDI
jgi:hypothetical protein